MPVYLVSPGDRLIRANTFSQAINYAAKASMQATPLRADDVLDRIQKGAKIEDARKPENQELPLTVAGESITAPSSEGAGPAAAAAEPPPEEPPNDERLADMKHALREAIRNDEVDTVEIDNVR